MCTLFCFVSFLLNIRNTCTPIHVANKQTTKSNIIFTSFYFSLSLQFFFPLLGLAKWVSFVHLLVVLALPLIYSCFFFC